MNTAEEIDKGGGSKPDWRTEQSRLLIVGCRKELAADLHVAVDTVDRWAQGAWPVPAYQAFRLSRAQQDYRYLSRLAERAGSILLPRLIVPPQRPTILLLADLALSFGSIFELMEKVTRNEPLSDEEQRQLEQDADKMKQAIDESIERSRQLRREREQKENK